MSNENPLFLLGQIHADVKWLRQEREKQLTTDEDHEARLVSLEQSRFKANFIVATIAATVGFVFSNVKEGIEWLKNLNPWS